MANFSLWATFGLCLLKLCLTETRKFLMNENTTVANKFMLQTARALLLDS